MNGNEWSWRDFIDDSNINWNHLWNLFMTFHHRKVSIKHDLLFDLIAKGLNQCLISFDCHTWEYQRKVLRFTNQDIYVSLQLRVQNRMRKWHFPLNFQNDIIWTSPFLPNIHNAINWAGATSKAFSSSEALISVLSKNSHLYDNTVHCTYIKMVMSGYQFMNLKFVHLPKNMPTEHQHLVTVLAYRKYCRRWFKYPPWTSQGNDICITELL